MAPLPWVPWPQLCVGMLTSTTTPLARMINNDMRILHTADWHLGDRLGRIDRTDDLRRAVERVAGYCQSEKVEVLLVAGDLFSELSRADSLRESIAHLQATFEPFLRGGGTILALTGNHDNETFCQTLRLVMTLAAPATGQPGELCTPGRLYLATDPSLVRLADREGRLVQFVLMPYPTPARYLREPPHRYASLEEKNQLLHAAFLRHLHRLVQRPEWHADLPAVLAAHIHLQAAQLPSLFRISEKDSVVFDPADLSGPFAYVALGHIHQPQEIRGQPQIRYSGSIERLDLGEARDHKSVTLVDLDASGLASAPRTLPLTSTAIYAVAIHDPKVDLPVLREQHPDAARDLVTIDIHYTAGVHDLEKVLRELDDLFPRWYERRWEETNALGPPLTAEHAAHGKGFEETVRAYLRQELINHPEAVQSAILSRAEALLSEAPA
jgi:exonuclease SbcD